jgi:hypothetical protein
MDQLPGENQVVEPQPIADPIMIVAQGKPLDVATSLQGPDMPMNAKLAGTIENVRRAFLFESGAAVQQHPERHLHG